MHVLDAAQASLVRDVADAIVPGCARVGAELYIDAALARMPEGDRSAALAAFAELGPAAAAGHEALCAKQFTPGFQMIRALACEAYYSDFVAPGRSAAGAWREIGFAPPLAARLHKDWSYLGVE